MKHSMLILGLFTMAFIATAEEPNKRGHLLLIGGGDKPAEVMRRFVDLAGGPKALIIVIPTASSLADTGAYYRDLLGEHGAENVVPLQLSNVSQAYEEVNLDWIAKAGGIFFSGGDQRKIIDVIRDTPLEAGIRKAFFERGIAIGGTSAGTACMSPIMITGDGDFTTIKSNNVDVWEGLGLFPDTILDQHFHARQRQNRLITAVMEFPELLGIGIDEATAVLLSPDLRFTVLGRGRVQIYDASKASIRQGAGPPSRQSLGATELRMHVLLPGQAFDLKARDVVKLDP